MATGLWDPSINERTSEKDLHRCVMEAMRSNDARVLSRAALAKEELSRRERKEWLDRFTAERGARANIQEFQAAQLKMILDLAGKQARAVRNATWAAWVAAVAAISIAIISVLEKFGMLTGVAEILTGAGGVAS